MDTNDEFQVLRRVDLDPRHEGEREILERTVKECVERGAYLHIEIRRRGEKPKESTIDATYAAGAEVRQRQAREQEA